MEETPVVESQQPQQNNNNAAACYDDLFPALPESALPKFNNVPNNKMRVGSSVVTQVDFTRRN